MAEKITLGETKKQKKESAPKVRNAGHFLFEKDANGLLQEIASYATLQDFQTGVKEKVKATDENLIPHWVHFRGRFSDVKVNKSVQVKITF